MDWKQLPLDVLGFARRVIARFGQDRCTRHAAALAYNSLLALAPMVAIGISMFSMFSSTAEMSSGLEDFIYQYLVPAAGDDVKVYMEQFAEQAGKLSAVGALFFLITALMLLFTIEESFNDIWRVYRGRPLVQRLTVYWAMVTLGPILMGASLTLSTYFLSMSFIDDTLGGGAGILGASVLPVLLEVVAFVMLYTVMPNARVNFKYAVVGGIVATVLFEITKRAFGLFILNFNSYQIIYGALASIPIFLVWIYLSWLITLIGAEVVALLGEEAEPATEAAGPDTSPKSSPDSSVPDTAG